MQLKFCTVKIEEGYKNGCCRSHEKLADYLQLLTLAGTVFLVEECLTNNN